MTRAGNERGLRPAAHDGLGGRPNGKVGGLSASDVGISKASGSGEVFHLKKLEDFNGNYAAVGTGLTAADGGAVAAMKNQNGVTIQVKSTTRGAKVTIGGGVDIQLLQ